MIKKIITAGLAFGTVFANMILPNTVSAQSTGCTGNSDPIAPPSASVGFYGGTLFVGAHEDYSASGNMGKGAPPQGWNPMVIGGTATQSGFLTVVSSNPGVVAVGGPGSYNALPGTTNIYATVPVAAVSAGTAIVTVTYSGQDYFAGWNVDCNVSQSFTVTVQNNTGTSVPIWTKTGTLMSSGGQRTPPAGYVTCGLFFNGFDNKGNNKATNVLFCPITATATAMGFSVAGPTYSIDMGNTHSFAQPMMCSQGWSGYLQLFYGVRTGGSSNQMDVSWCGDVISTNAANSLSVDPSSAPGMYYTGQGFVYCPSTDQIPTGVATAPNKNDSWDRVYCGPVRFGVTPLPPPIPGTVIVNSVDSVSSTPVKASWGLTGKQGNICTVTGIPCYGTSQTYSGVDASGAQLYTLSSWAAASSSQYSLKELKKSGIATAPTRGLLDSILALGRDLIPVANAVQTFVNSPGTPLSPGFQLALTPTGSTNTGIFTIVWNPIAAMTVGTPPTLTTSTPSATAPVTNTGAPNSTLQWTAGAPVYSGSATGWLTVSPANGTITNPATGGSSSQSVTFTANTTGIASGTYTASVTFTGMSTADGSSLPNQTITVTLYTAGGAPPGPPPPGSPVSIVSVTPASTVNVGVPVTTTCTGGSGAYGWNASSPNVAPPTGSGSTYTFSSLWPGTYTITCYDANTPSNKANTTVTVNPIAPVCTFKASPAQITLPGNSVLTWTCAGAQSCYINAPINPVPVNGNMSVAPTTNTTYTLTCQSIGLGPLNQSQVQTTVRVVGPGIIEGNP